MLFPSKLGAELIPDTIKKVYFQPHQISSEWEVSDIRPFKSLCPDYLLMEKVFSVSFADLCSLFNYLLGLDILTCLQNQNRSHTIISTVWPIQHTTGILWKIQRYPNADVHSLASSIPRLIVIHPSPPSTCPILGRLWTHRVTLAV